MWETNVCILESLCLLCDEQLNVLAVCSTCRENQVIWENHVHRFVHMTMILIVIDFTSRFVTVVNHWYIHLQPVWRGNVYFVSTLCPLWGYSISSKKKSRIQSAFENPAHMLSTLNLHLIQIILFIKIEKVQ